jgi:signal transduction histidine kinase/CHASE2 domain-containing sensor protein
VQVFAAVRTSAFFTIAASLASAALGTWVAWQAPGIDRYSKDWLVRLRGPVPVSSEIAILAIDDSSIAKLGRFPWSRSVIAQAIDAVAARHPKAIALDVLFTDSTTPSDDQGMADAVERAGNVVLAAQLVERGVYGERAQWLMPLPMLAAGAAAIGHVNTATESDGSARRILVEQSDDAGKLIRALPVEAFRIGNRIPEQEVVNGWREVVIGQRSIPVTPSENPFRGDTRIHRAAAMEIDYAGPSGSFAAQQYSISELLNGKVPAGALDGKYVLVGATAASLGQRFASPFVHYSDKQGGQHGESIAGVEVLANALNTILRRRFYSEMSEWAAFVYAVSAAWLMIGLLALAQGSRSELRFLAAIALGLAIIIGVSYFCFVQLLIIPALLAAVVSFGLTGISSLAMRSVKASLSLDQGIQQVLSSLMHLESNVTAAATLESMVRITGVTGAVLLKSKQVIGSYGYPGPLPSDFEAHPSLPAICAMTKIGLGAEFRLVLVHPTSNPPSRRLTQLAEAMAKATLDALTTSDRSSRALLPDALEEKTNTIVGLNQRIARQAEFFHASMRAAEDGLLIAAPDGVILFANTRAASILDLDSHLLLDRNLFDLQALAEVFQSPRTTEFLEQVVLDRRTLECEVAVGSRRYTLRIAPVIRSDDGNRTAGIVASLSDITRQHELAQVRSDVVTLVSHEMRTPLTAIQGMTELLAAFDIEPVRRKEMMLAINDEVKRLTRMISDYLDIARLEMGKTSLRIGPFNVESVLERSLLLFEPLAQEKSIRLIRDFSDALTPILGDSDLINRVFSNLISNALKYSPPDTEVKISTSSSNNRICIAIEDQGYGIPAEDVERIFEKFFRVPRLQDADVPGTGLGLTFVREIVELHGGAVSVRNASGGGSVFTVCLPFNPTNPVR